VGTRTATKLLRDGERVTVNGQSGKIVAGDVAPVEEAKARREPAREASPPPEVTEATATRLYVNLAMAGEAERVAALPVDGVGLLRAEFMITDALSGRHPKKMLAEGKREEVVRALTSAVSRITRAFAP